MNLQNYTREGALLPHMKCDSLEHAVTELVSKLEEAGVIGSGPDLVAEVLRREQEGSTAVGGGLVIPHARYEGLEDVHIALATLAAPLNLKSEDGSPVDIVMLLVGPERDPRQMLRVLARLARLVKDRSFLDSIRKATTSAELFAVFEDTAD